MNLFMFIFIRLYLIILIPNAIVSIMHIHIIHFRRILFLFYDQEVNNKLKLNIHYLLIFRIK
jgi:cell division protein FtsL